MTRQVCIVAKNAKGHVVTYGVARFKAAAEAQARRHVADHDRGGSVVSYEVFTMPKPKFRVGQKVKLVGTSIVRRVLAVPTVPNPHFAGCVCTHTIFGGCKVWESENRYEVDRG